jgi:allophanate hydrolase
VRRGGAPVQPGGPSTPPAARKGWHADCVSDLVFKMDTMRSDPAFIDRTLVAGSPVPAAALAGRRFAVKDNIDVAGVPTTAGCPAFEYLPQSSAAVVERLLAAGATMVGKTNLDQFACGLNGTRSPYGAVPNAFDPAYVSGGSSSGSAVAVARGDADFALGTDTAGSGRVPAAFNNVVGLKPTRGLLSNRGVVPACRSIDCVSIFATTVADAVDVLLAAAAHDPLDPGSRRQPPEPAFFPQRFRFGVPSADGLEFFGDDAARLAFDAARARLRALGGTEVALPYAPFRDAAALLYEDAFVAERYAAIRTFFDGHAAEVHPVVRAIVGQGRRFSAADWCDAADRLGLLKQRCDALLADVDVMVVPSAPTIYRIDAMLADPLELNRRLGFYTNFVNLLDYAALAVPTDARDDGLPAGVTLVGPAYSDLRLADLGQRLHHDAGTGVGATGRPLPPPREIRRPVGSTVRLAVVGAHLSGMPLNGQLLERGARLLRACRTAPEYRLHALAGTVPPKPGLVHVGAGGAAIEIEEWEMPVADYGTFVALIPAPLGIGTLRLEDGSSVQGFLCEPSALAGSPDISHLGGWRAYVARLAA